MTIHIDMATRKTAAFPPDIRARIAEVLASHSGIARPEGTGVVAQLTEAGVEVVDRSRCTIEDEDLFSYRRQGPASGRLAGLIRLRP